MQVTPKGADPGDQSDHDGRVRGPLGVGFYRGAVEKL